mmetsp:Transcript_2318/g.5510  ORF Transcript_2318/g.5510 Transcript_2318/m.5510 type:complete len:605 (+) Transcript_2318:817-2631(+)
MRVKPSDEEVDEARVLHVHHGRGPADDGHLLGLHVLDVELHEPVGEHAERVLVLHVERREGVEHVGDVVRVKALHLHHPDGAAEGAEHPLVPHLHLGVRVQDDADGRRVERLEGHEGEHLLREELAHLERDHVVRHDLGVGVERDGDGLRVEGAGRHAHRHLGKVLKQRLVLHIEPRERVENVLHVLALERGWVKPPRDPRHVLHQRLVADLQLGEPVQDQRNALRLEHVLHAARNVAHVVEQLVVANLRLGERVHDVAQRLSVEEQRIHLHAHRCHPPEQPLVRLVRLDERVQDRRHVLGVVGLGAKLPHHLRNVLAQRRVRISAVVARKRIQNVGDGLEVEVGGVPPLHLGGEEGEELVVAQARLGEGVEHDGDVLREVLLGRDLPRDAAHVHKELLVGDVVTRKRVEDVGNGLGGVGGGGHAARELPHEREEPLVLKPKLHVRVHNDRHGLGVELCTEGLVLRTAALDVEGEGLEEQLVAHVALREAVERHPYGRHVELGEVVALGELLSPLRCGPHEREEGLALAARSVYGEAHELAIHALDAVEHALREGGHVALRPLPVPALRAPVREPLDPVHRPHRVGAAHDVAGLALDEGLQEVH